MLQNMSLAVGVSSTAMVAMDAMDAMDAMAATVAMGATVLAMAVMAAQAATAAMLEAALDAFRRPWLLACGQCKPWLLLILLREVVR